MYGPRDFRRKKLAAETNQVLGSGGPQALLDGAPVLLQLTHTAIPTRGTGSPTFTRASTATVTNNDGYLVTALAGEARFVGARRVRNFVPNSETLTAAAGWALSNITTPGSATAVAPDGTTTAWILTASGVSGQWYKQITGLLAGGSGLSHIWLRRNTGTGTVGLFTAAGAFAGDLAITPAWTQYSLKTTTTAGGTSYFGIQITASGDKVEVWHPQFEDVTAQTTQTAGEYVSVGVPSDWAGDELVTNGTFDTDTTWIKESGWTIGGGAAIAATASATLYQTDTLAIGTKYVASFSVSSVSAGSVSIRIGAAPLVPYDFKTAAGTYSVEFVADAVSTLVGVIGVGFTGTVDNISVKPAIYHGSFVDGVKCFPTDLSGNPLPTAYTYDAVSLNGVAGTYVSTNDSVAASITGDIDIRVKVALNDWTPAGGSNATLVSKWDNATRRSYFFGVEAVTGKLIAYTSADGSTLTNAAIVSTVATGFTDGAVGWSRMTYKAATGKFNFYTGSDGATWTQLGDADVSGTASAIFDSTSIVEIGSLLAATAWMTSGKIYQAQIYNGINGTLAVDFDASRYAGGSTLTGSTGETWTLQGNAVIHPTNSPMLGYSAEGARTNLCLQSQTFGTTWSPNVTTVSSNAAVAPDGTTTADLVYPNSTGVNRYIGQSGLTTTAATWTFSFYAKYAGAGGWAYCIDLTGSSVVAYFDIQNGAVGTVSAGHSASIEDAGNGWYRCSLITVTAPAGAANVYIGNADANGATTITANGTNGIYLWGAQVELGSFASSYIATTTIAVARNADVLTYSSAGNASTSALWLYAELKPAYQPADLIAVTVDDGSNNNRVTITESASGGRFSPFIASGGAVQYAPLSAGAMSTSSSNKVAVTMSALGADAATNAELLTTTGAITPPASFTTIRISGRATGDFFWFGNIRNVRIGQRQLSSSELQAVTR